MRRWTALGCVTLVVSLLLCVGVLPPLIFVAYYGRLPLYRVPQGTEVEGMTKKEVRAMLGSPHIRYAHADPWTIPVIAATSVAFADSPFGDGPLLTASAVFPRTYAANETWVYLSDLLGFTYFGVNFGIDGRVSGSWI